MQSLEASDPNQRPSLSGRGPVSKSHSFGGYTETPPPRQISRQGDLASSSWRLSPSSSGYRTLSLHSTDSVTPSPTGGASPEPVQGTNTEGVAVMWAVTDFSAVPVGALVIHPQTGRPLTNPDGSVYHFDPSNPPVIDAGYTQADQNIDISNEKKRGRLEKQHSFIDNESECQLGEDCKIKCNCDFRRQETCHRNNSDKNTTQTEQKVHQKPPSPHKTRYEPSVEAANHNPAPDAPSNHRPYEATNQKPATDHPANHRYDSQSYTNHRPYGHYESNQRQFEIQRPPSYDASQKYDSTNQRGSESANHRALRLANHCTPEVQYISQQFQQGYSHEDVTSPQACQQPYLQQDMGHIGQVAAHEPELRQMVVYPGLTQYYGYQTVHPEEQKQMPPTTVNNNNTFTIDPSYPYAPVDYATQCTYEAPPAPQAPPAAHRPYALYTPMTPVTPVASVEPIMQYPHHHYQYQDLQWQNMQPVVQIPHPTPKLYVPELYNIVQYPTGSVPLYPQYNVMYPQVIPQPYPVYQAVHQMPDKQDTRRGSLTSHRHSKRNSVSGSSRNTPLTATPEEKQVPYEESHSHSTNPNQYAPSHKHSQNLQRQNSGLSDQQSGSKDSNDLAAKIKQINDQMSQLNTRERDRDNYKRNEWKRRNSGNGILGSYPFNGRFVGRPQSTDDSQLSSAARAIVNSIRSMQASNHTHYQEVCGDYHQNQYRHRDHDRHRRDDKDTDRRSAPVYTPPYLLRQMSPGTWCRRSPAPLHPGKSVHCWTLSASL
ncbi:hypothetical protein O0L34_g13296 [Tuta absoluta]|nr:hypothetical protein O0L34_g13296 [Tuta absoluta]